MFIVLREIQPETDVQRMLSGYDSAFIPARVG